MLDHSGLCQRHVGMCWARVGTILALSWAILGYVGTFRPHWERIGLVLSPFSGILLFVLDLLGLCLSDLGLLHLGYAGLIANTWAMPTLFQAHVQFALSPEPLKLWYSRF